MFDFPADKAFFSLIFVFSIFALFSEILAGGGFFGTLFVIGLLITLPIIGILPLFLVVIGCLLVLLEVFRPGRGLFFLLGCLFLFSSIFSPFSFMGMWWASWVFLFLLLIAVFLISFFFYLSFRKIRSLKGTNDLFSLKGMQGIVSDNPSYAKIRGTQWKIVSNDTLVPGDKVRVLSLLEDMVLMVEKFPKDS